MDRMRAYRGLFLVLLFLAIFFQTGQAKKNADPALEKREEMITISRQLGVTCKYCHDVKDFTKDNLAAYKVAKDHMRITRWLNLQGFRNKPRVDCFICHRGQAKPRFKEPRPGGGS